MIIMSTSSRALVLSGGGNAGMAWMAGIISGLRELGADLGDADLIVGTSAGARTGAQLATGALDQMADMYRRSGVPDVTVHATLPQFLAASMRIIAMGPLGRQLASSAGRRSSVAAQIPVRQWPRQRLLIAAVDAGSGRRVAFSARSGGSL